MGNPLNIYVAGRTGEIETVNLIQKAAEERGHSITHDWTGPEGGIKPDWSQNPDEALAVAGKDRDGVFNADAIIMCGWGCSEKNKGGLGCFVEAGIAIAVGIPIVVVGPMRESVFWYLPLVERINLGRDGFNGPQAIEEAITKAEVMVNPVIGRRDDEICVLAKDVRPGDSIHVTVMGGEEDFEVAEAIPRADNHNIILKFNTVGGAVEDEVPASKEMWIKRKNSGPDPDPS